MMPAMTSEGKTQVLGLVFEYLFDNEAVLRINRQCLWGPLSLWHHMRMQHYARMHNALTGNSSLLESFLNSHPRSHNEDLFDSWGYKLNPTMKVDWKYRPGLNDDSV